MAQKSGIICPTCESTTAMRVSRTGFLQRTVLWRVGIYPWKCGTCGSTFLARRRRRPVVEPEQSEIDPGQAQGQA